MATQTNIIQIVGREQDRDRVFNKQGLDSLIANYCDEKKAHYTVFSIIGAQSSGKSTLMNAIFGTSFEVMDAKKGRNATTKGIWAAMCNQFRTLVLDIEGSDGAVNQNDAGFENQSALFALLVSDIIFVNIGIQDIGRLHAGNIPLLHRIFQERLNHGMHNTVMVFAVRDYDAETPMKVVEEELTSAVHMIYSQFPEQESATLGRCIELHIECFPHKKYEPREFENKCTQMQMEMRRIACKEFVRSEQNNWPIDAFPTLGENLWNDILQNKRLDMASYWQIASRQCCMVIMSQILSSLKSNQHYLSLKNDDGRDPRVFCSRLDDILNFILSGYDKDAQCYNREDAEHVKEELRAKILNDAKRAFVKTMDNFVDNFMTELTVVTKVTIEKDFKENLFTDMETKVLEHSRKFKNETKDLDLYNDVIEECQKEIEDNLKVFIKSIRDKAVLRFVGRYSAKFLIMAINIISVSTGSLPLLSSFQTSGN